MKLAAGLAILACGFAATWLCLPLAPTGFLALGIGLAAGALAAGPLIDRLRPKPVLVAGLVALGAASGTRFPAGALGLGIGMTLVAANALVPAAPRGGRAAALNLLNLLLPVGAVFNPAFGVANVPVATLPIAAVALAFALWMRMPAPPEPTAPEKRPAISLLAVLLFLYAACEAGTWNWLAEYWRVTRVLDRETAWQVLCYGVPLGLIAGRAWSARLLASVAPLRVVQVASLAMALAAGLLLLARSPSASWVAAFVAGAAMAPVLPTVLAMAGEALPRWPATGMGIALAAGSLGVWAVRSSPPRGMLALPAVSLAMALVAWAMGPRKRAE